MAVKTRKSAAAASSNAQASSEHLHPSSAAAAKSKPSTSSSSSTASTVHADGSTHVAAQSAASSKRQVNAYEAANSWTWNPIRIIERKLFRAYWNVEATFVLSMLEAWEVFLVIVVFVVLTLLLWYSLIHYFPRHAQQVATRALYYVYGNSPPPQLAAAVTTSDTTTNASTAAAAAAASATDGVLEKLIASSNQLWASLDTDKAASNSNPEVVDRLISNLNKVKQMMGSTGKVDL
ncbi:conserved hypothetical protein [Sporisorium reilianum SRZ2]|uniref:Uncharacterized protein n=1 Tax=Sporisorium reilianum (strain SRZ2) TaxID=999809 RepID=E6ZSW4_SPORE|nr:conserved hypothetical protein [Sporisorium reilianum SRZ2]